MTDSGLDKYGEKYREDATKNTNWCVFPEHSGEVLITSKIGDEDYVEAGASISFDTTYLYTLLGDTIFENINVKTHAYYNYANYYNLTLGDGITTDGTGFYPARSIYLGLGRTVGSATFRWPGESERCDSKTL